MASFVLVMLVSLVSLAVVVGIGVWATNALRGGGDGARVRALESRVDALQRQLEALAAPGAPAVGAQAMPGLAPAAGSDGPSTPAGGSWPVRARGETIDVAGTRLEAAVVAQVEHLRDQKVAAVKLVRERTGLPLKQAVDVVEAIRAGRY